MPKSLTTGKPRIFNDPPTRKVGKGHFWGKPLPGQPGTVGAVPGTSKKKYSWFSSPLKCLRVVTTSPSARCGCEGKIRGSIQGEGGGSLLGNRATRLILGKLTPIGGGEKSRQKKTRSTTVKRKRKPSHSSQGKERVKGKKKMLPATTTLVQQAHGRRTEVYNSLFA